MIDTDPLRRCVERLTSGDVDGAAAAFTTNGVLVVPFPDGDVVARGTEQIVEALGIAVTAFPHLRYVPHRRYLVPGGVVEEATLFGQPAVPAAAAPPAEGAVRVDVRIRADLTDGLIGEAEVAVDVPALRHQLGIPTAAGAATTFVADLRAHRAGVELIDTEALRESAQQTRPSSRRALLLAGTATTALVVAALAFTSLRGGTHHPLARTATSGIPSSSPAPGPSGASSSAVPQIAIVAPRARPVVQPGRQLVVSTDLLFAFGSADLTSRAAGALRALAAQVRQLHVAGTIQVNGYTDSVGSPAYDKALSLARALAVARALAPLLSGLPVTLVPQGFGPADPVAPNATAAGRAHNRRVSVVLPAT